VLCTENKTFQIRQVQTSNSLYIVQPVETEDENGVSTMGICAIATCPATLELSIMKAASADLYLRNLLVEWEDEHKPMLVDNKSIRDVYADVPLSNAEIQLAWTNLCAFELEDTAYKPSPHLLNKAWKAVILAAAAEKGGFETAALLPSFWHSVADEENLPEELFDAIRLRIRVGEPEAPKETASWLAGIILEDTSKEEIDRSDFLTSWKDSLPETWRSEASLDLIKPFTNQSDPTTISLKSKAVVKTDTTGITAPSAAARKWHERLKKGR
jgi:sister chromatid cohesion protein DCC1